jgi:lysophospholipase L1-like esterase
MKAIIRLGMMACVALLAVSCKTTQPTIFMAGDSTSEYATQEKKGYIRGWAQMLPLYLDNDKVKMDIRSRGGRSTKSFIADGIWDKLINDVKKGDYVFIQFGHNDASKRPERHASYADYRKNLIRMINEVRAKGATPVLLTSVVQRTFMNKVLIDDRLKGYPAIMRKLAKEMDVMLIDCHQKTRDFVVTIGDEASKPYYRYLPPGVDPFKPKGIADDTHMMEKGAKRVAAFVAEGMLELDCKLSSFVIEEKVMGELNDER